MKYNKAQIINAIDRLIISHENYLKAIPKAGFLEKVCISFFGYSRQSFLIIQVSTRIQEWKDYSNFIKNSDQETNLVDIDYETYLGLKDYL